MWSAWAVALLALPAAALPVRAPQPAGFAERQLGSFVDQSIGQAYGVLLGVGDGSRALDLLDAWPRGVLFLVDPYIHLRRGYDREDNLDDAAHQRNYDQLRHALRERADVQGRYSFVREFSFAVPPLWREKRWGPEPAFIFHDANPSYGAVRTDLHAWWPLLAPGGLLAGANYTTQGDGAIVGVRLAVDEFAAERNLQVFITSDPREPAWLLMKDISSR